ncbi:prepilin-type N-terminal cleavage/methylation domain-containing protein [Paraglaciecola sp. L3A3]|uniref:type IV pilus modification PilV family protein n=1 Tax=Paraglaciecola sp. L3A3 TaxID=2686358 RepID=UPI00131CA5B3|nr:prepilin-type N-terminal cleavage/methylation domain-containing protein [Paraglaciecola sp. L3A3]
MQANNQGFSLVEVLVASLIIMLGVTGYVTLQTEYVVADRNLNLRNIATQLADDKIQDLVYFQQLLPVAGKRVYNNIKSNLGGNIPAGVTSVQLSLEKADVHSFELYWTVADLYYIDSDFDGVADIWVKVGDSLMPSVLPLYADIKMVSVNILWTDIEGQPQKLALSTNIAPIQQSNSFQVMHRESSVNSLP